MEACTNAARFHNGLVLFLLTPTGIVVSKSSKTTWLYHFIAATTAIVWRAGRNDWCREARIAVAITVTIIVTLTRTHTIVLAATFPTDTPQ